ncbi:hypothetical protein PILCRDRAFT_819992 [Piloderma croceum F 1598]|uniref:BTB domain-containing protein n=1 Tax=Piloderma croceum (strain F 1598) TaxID=765440 RepID=A0A0C3B8T3_PILCF|nr:hypothetical protein PILCRDRAFT_819992 [Piloderma croceum F 1598]
MDQNTADIPIHGEPWFDDGNVLLQAQSTQFKVHRGVLSANSGVFRDMLTLPQPAVGREQVVKGPVVNLSDSAEDWTH